MDSIQEHANLRDITIYEVFEYAGRFGKIPDEQIDDAFIEYKKTRTIPLFIINYLSNPRRVP